MKIVYVLRSLAVWGGIERIMADKMNHLTSLPGVVVYLLTTDQGTHPTEGFAAVEKALRAETGQASLRNMP